VDWINDSKATNIESTLVALRSLERPSVVLLGGRGKTGADYERLAGALRSARAVVCFGEAGPAIAEGLERAGLSPQRQPTLDAAVDAAASKAEPGDIVLLSPACASFDEFTDYEHRGRHFADRVRGLLP
jgi:UDP-N-acetylmuramoylalanine--D-glutamate ligase